MRKLGLEACGPELIPHVVNPPQGGLAASIQDFQQPPDYNPLIRVRGHTQGSPLRKRLAINLLPSRDCRSVVNVETL